MYFLALATDYDETLTHGGSVADDVRSALRGCAPVTQSRPSPSRPKVRGASTLRALRPTMVGAAAADRVRGGRLPESRAAGAGTNEQEDHDLNAEPSKSRASSGVAGLDELLGGGFPRNQIYLVEGGTGAGKTTLGLQFLIAGAARGERVLYLGFSETPEDLERIAGAHGWSLAGVDLHKVVSEEAASRQAQYTLFPSSEVELHELMEQLNEAISRRKPDRLLIDPVSALRWFAADPFEYRRHVESLGRALHPAECTTLLIDDAGMGEQQFHPRSIVHGVLTLARMDQEYGRDRRRLRIEKLRGESFAGGYHDYEIVTGGLEVYPRIEIASRPAEAADHAAPLLSRHPEFGPLLGGGIPWGCAVLLAGQAGTGKSSLAAVWSADALASGRSVLYLTFDEGIETLLQRSRALAVEFPAAHEAGTLELEQIDPAGSSPGRVSDRIRRAVDREKGRLGVVVLDSLSGYLHATGSSRYLDLQLHQLLAYLRRRGVITLMVLTQRGMLGDPRSNVDLSYISDVMVFMNFFESGGRLHRAVSVVKHRAYRHDQEIRELVFEAAGIRLRAPPQGLRGLLSGAPRDEGAETR